MKKIIAIAIETIINASPSTEFKNNDIQYKEDWMPEEIVKKIGKVSSSPYRDLYNAIRQPRPLSSLATYMAMDLVDSSEFNTPLYFEIRKLLLEHFLYLDTLLIDARNKLYLEQVKKEAAERVASVIDTPPVPSVFDKEDSILSEDELLEEEASFWPDDTMIQDQVRRRKLSKWRAAYKKRYGLD